MVYGGDKFHRHIIHVDFNMCCQYIYHLYWQVTNMDINNCIIVGYTIHCLCLSVQKSGAKDIIKGITFLNIVFYNNLNLIIFKKMLAFSK